jgi:hypothetical protein
VLTKDYLTSPVHSLTVTFFWVSCS